MIGADISAFAGETGELRFIGENQFSRALLDNIRFSTVFAGPWLSIKRSTFGIQISWPTWAEGEGHTLESTQNVSDGWSVVTAEPVRAGKFLSLRITDSEGLAFFRLVKR